MIVKKNPEAGEQGSQDCADSQVKTAEQKASGGGTAIVVPQIDCYTVGGTAERAVELDVVAHVVGQEGRANPEYYPLPLQKQKQCSSPHDHGED